MLDDSRKLKLSAQYRFQWEEAQKCYVLLYPEGLIKLGQSSAEILKQFLEPQSFKDALSNLQAKFPDAKIENDVTTFVTHAIEKNWLEYEE